MPDSSRLPPTTLTTPKKLFASRLFFSSTIAGSMSKEHTALPMQSLSVDEKHDPISGHASPTSRNTLATVNGGSNGRDYLPVGNNKASPEKKLHPAVIISLWIFMSASVIGE